MEEVFGEGRKIEKKEVRNSISFESLLLNRSTWS